MKRILFLLAVVGLAIGQPAIQADVKLPPVLGSHMVLQRELPVPVWGTAAPGEKITVAFQGQTKTTEADKDGKWLVKLDPLKASAEPAKLTVNNLTLDDVLVGEVWVGSGQSNMQGNVSGYSKGDPVLASYLEGSYPTVRYATAKGNWVDANPKSMGGFSAILFSMGLRLNKELGVPIGLLHGSVGGTPSGHWLSEEALANDQVCQDMMKKLAKTYDAPAEKAKYEAAFAKWEKEAEAAKKDNKAPPRKPELNQAPGATRGAKVGHLYEAHIRGMLPFAIRGVLWDQGESGTAISGIDQYTLMGALINGWRKEWGQDFAFLYVQKPSGDGCAWDPKDPITSKASAFAPLPAAVPAATAGSNRENHIRIRNYSKTAMVESSDLGNGIHPSNKSGYGERAARVALGFVYGKKIEYNGPVYASHKAEDDTVRIKFTHTGAGLAFKHGEKLQGFAIAGEDKMFRWANATIDGDTIVVSSPEVKKPLEVRYAWSQQHPWANLFNKDGLPAQAFRTDSW